MGIAEAARAEDASALLALRGDAVRWMHRRGIRQWTVGDVTLSRIGEQLRRHEWSVVREGHTVVAAVRVVEADEAMWGPGLGDAFYVHGLVVDRRHVGRGLGRRLLEWVEDVAAEAGRTYVRLDCAESNARLRSYYRAAGYHEVGRRDLSPLPPAILLEKHLASR